MARLQHTKSFLNHPFIRLDYKAVSIIMCCLCQHRGTTLDFHPLGRMSAIAANERLSKFIVRCPECHAVAELTLGRSIWNFLCACSAMDSALDS